MQPTAAGIIQGHQRRFDFNGFIHDPADFLPVDRTDRSAEDRHVLGIGEYQPPIYGSVAGDDAVAGNPLFLHTEINRLALGQFVDLHKTARIEQQIEAFARRQFASLEMTFNGFGPAAHFSLIFQGFKSFPFTLMGFGLGHLLPSLFRY